MLYNTFVHKVNYFDDGGGKMENKVLSEQLLHSWVLLSGILKNTRITKGLMYNEATVMLLVYNRYCEDAEGLICVKEIIQRTKMLKSLVNRTVNALEKKGLVQRCQVEGDRRMVYLKCNKDNLDIFLRVHNASLSLAQSIIDVIGQEDAETFIRIVKKLEDAGYSI